MAPPPPPLPSGYIPVTNQGYGVQGIEVSLTGAILSFTLFGISLIQFNKTFRLLFAMPLHDRRMSWKINFGLLLLLLVTDVADSIVKAIFQITDVRKVILEGVNGIIHVPSTSIGTPLMDGWVAMLVQIIYVRRAISITPSKSWIVTVVATIAILMAITQFAAAIWSGVVLLQPEQTWASQLNTPILIWLTVSPACDVLVCLTFIFHLKSHKTDFSNTRALISKWIFFTLEIGLLSTIFQLLTLFLWLGIPNSPYYTLPAWVISKVYLNSILVLFNTILSGGLKRSNVNHDELPKSFASRVKSFDVLRSGGSKSSPGRSSESGGGRRPSMSSKVRWGNEGKGMGLPTVVMTRRNSDDGSAKALNSANMVESIVVKMDVEEAVEMDSIEDTHRYMRPMGPPSDAQSSRGASFEKSNAPRGF